jgi:hypothetical protein
MPQNEWYENSRAALRIPAFHAAANDELWDLLPRGRAGV